jgi:hypothetical protein
LISKASRAAMQIFANTPWSDTDSCSRTDIHAEEMSAFFVQRSVSFCSDDRELSQFKVPAIANVESDTAVIDFDNIHILPDYVTKWKAAMPRSGKRAIL